MILVVGRPGLDERDRLDRMAGRISQAAAAAGGRVELVGSVGDDADGERVVLALGQAGVGHAALLRDPAGVTPRAGGPGGALPRLDESDVGLGLAYLTECRVLVLAESVDVGVQQAVIEAAEYHDAHLILLVGADEPPPAELPDKSTVLERPASDEGAFTALVGRYAVALAQGVEPAEAWQSAVRREGWEPAFESEENG
jgi:hypothetical protein